MTTAAAALSVEVDWAALAVLEALPVVLELR